MTYDGNPGPGLGQAQKCGGVKRVNGIPTPRFMVACIRMLMLKDYMRN